MTNNWHELLSFRSSFLRIVSEKPFSRQLEFPLLSNSTIHVSPLLFSPATVSRVFLQPQELRRCLAAELRCRQRLFRLLRSSVCTPFSCCGRFEKTSQWINVVCHPSTVSPRLRSRPFPFRRPPRHLWLTWLIPPQRRNSSNPHAQCLVFAKTA